MLHFLSSVWVLRGYNSSLWGKLYSDWHLTLHRQEQRAVILHCFHLADSLTSLWALGQPEETSETRASPARRTRQRSASRSATFCHRPDVIMLPTHPITRSRVARAAASKQRRHRQGWVCAGLTRVPELTVTHTSAYWLKKSQRRLRARSYGHHWELIRHCNHQKQTKSNKITGALWRNNMG